MINMEKIDNNTNSSKRSHLFFKPNQIYDLHFQLAESKKIKASFQNITFTKGINPKVIREININNYRIPNIKRNPLNVNTSSTFIFILFILVYFFLPIIIDTSIIEVKLMPHAFGEFYPIYNHKNINRPEQIYLNNITIFINDSNNDFFCDMNESINFKPVSNVTYTIDLFFSNTFNDLSNMFKSCEIIESVDFKNFNISEVTNMEHMFEIYVP